MILRATLIVNSCFTKRMSLPIERNAIFAWQTTRRLRLFALLFLVSPKLFLVKNLIRPAARTT